METKKIGIIVGSLRRESFSRKIAQALESMLPERFETHTIDIGALPIYNQDLDDDGNPPVEWTRFREEVQSMDAYLFVTPEYNRSIPPVIKNALDVGSRPMGANVWAKKPGAVVSVSPGRTGAFGANHILRQSAVFLDIFMMQQPEAYIGGVADMLDEKDQLKDEKSAGFCQSIADGFVQWVDRFA